MNKETGTLMNQRDLGKLEMLIDIIWDEVKKTGEWAVANEGCFLPRPFSITYEQLARWSGFSVETVKEIDSLFTECKSNAIKEWLPYFRAMPGYEESSEDQYISIVAEARFHLRLGGGVRMSCFENYDIYLGNRHVGEVTEEEVKLALHAYCRFLIDRVQKMLDKGWDYEVISLMMMYKKPFTEALFREMKAYVGRRNEA